MYESKENFVKIYKCNP